MLRARSHNITKVKLADPKIDIVRKTLRYNKKETAKHKKLTIKSNLKMSIMLV